MKRTYKTLFTLAAFSFALTACSQLQDSLSSEMQKKLDEETGIASIAEKVWYYNSDSNLLNREALEKTIESGSVDNYRHSFTVNFGKKVALNGINGKIEVTWTEDDGEFVSKTFTRITGSFTDDYTGFNIDMSDVVRILGELPDGRAVMNLKLGGFVSAEGSQSGRPISTFEAKNIQIKPLYDATEFAFSTIGFTSDSKCLIELNGNVTLDDEDFIVHGTGSDGTEYSFSVESEKNNLCLVPLFDNPGLDGVSVPLHITGIKPLTSGDSFSQNFSIVFSQYAIVIDGKKDSNFSTEKGAIVYEDAAGDQDAFKKTYNYSVVTESDITEVAITSDDSYVYIGVSGDFVGLTWDNVLSVMISNGNLTGANGANPSSDVHCAGTETFAYKPGTRTTVQPNVYIAHQPGLGDTGAGFVSAYAYTSSNVDITSQVKLSPMGWKTSLTGEYIEYAIPLGSLTGLEKGNTLSVIVATALHWGEGNAVVDIAPNSAMTKTDGDNIVVEYSFANGIQYTIPE